MLNFSKAEMVYLVHGLKLIRDGNYKPTDKLEAGLLIDKIEKEAKAHENILRPKRGMNIWGKQGAAAGQQKKVPCTGKR